MASRINILPDATFGYVLVFLIVYLILLLNEVFLNNLDEKPANIVRENIHLILIISSVFSSFFSFIDPIEICMERKIFPILKKDFKNKEKIPETLMKLSFKSSYIENSKTRIKVGVYLIISFSIICIILPLEALKAESLTAKVMFILLFLLVIVFGNEVDNRLRKDFEELPDKIYVIMMYIDKVKKYPKIQGEMMTYLNFSRDALQIGNWAEAFRYLYAIDPFSSIIPPEKFEKLKNKFGIGHEGQTI